MLITGHCLSKRKHFLAKRESLKQFSLRQHSVKNHNQISQMESWGMRWTCHDCHSSIGCLQLFHAKDFSCCWFWWIRLVDTSPTPIWKISWHSCHHCHLVVFQGRSVFDPTGNDQTGLQLCRTQDCRRDLRRGTDDRSATCGATTQLGVHNRLYLYTTAAQEIRQRKYTKDALASFNPHTGIQFIHFLRLLRIRFSKCQMSNVKCQIHPHRNELELRAV